MEALRVKIEQVIEVGGVADSLAWPTRLPTTLGNVPDKRFRHCHLPSMMYLYCSLQHTTTHAPGLWCSSDMIEIPRVSSFKVRYQRRDIPAVDTD